MYLQFQWDQQEALLTQQAVFKLKRDALIPRQKELTIKRIATATLWVNLLVSKMDIPLLMRKGQNVLLLFCI